MEDSQTCFLYPRLPVIGKQKSQRGNWKPLLCTTNFGVSKLMSLVNYHSTLELTPEHLIISCYA